MKIYLQQNSQFNNLINNIHYTLTKYVVGANANPPKKASRPPKKGIIIAMNIVKAVRSQYTTSINKISY